MKVFGKTVVVNSLIPFPGYKAITLFGIIFVRKAALKRFKQVDLDHELIHRKQTFETLFLFMLLYPFEYLVKLLFVSEFKKAYKSISFEQEAYEYEKHPQDRKPFGWFKYLFSIAD